MVIQSNNLKLNNVTNLLIQILDAKRLQLLIIVLSIFIVDANTLFNQFVYDDNLQVVDNVWITNVKYMPDIFNNDATHSLLKGASNYYRPLMNIIYMINYYLFGLKPWGFHLVNVLLHVGVTILVFSVISLLIIKDKSTPSRSFLSIPFVASLIFAVHPINTEVVAWVACVPELSFTFFCLLSLYFHMKSLYNFDRGHFVSLAFFGIAIFCKETAVTLLPILVLYDYIYSPEKFDKRRYVMRYVPFISIVTFYLLIRFNALGGMAPSSRHPELNTFGVIINVLPLFYQYLEKLLLPINLNAFYVLHPVHSITELKWIYSLLIIIAYVALGYLLLKKNKTAFFGLMIITIPLLPVLYIRGLGENTFSDRYLYFPSIGFAIIVGSLFTIKGINTDSWKKPLSILLISIWGVYSIGTIKRNIIWHDELRLWTDTVQKSPDSDLVHLQLGTALAKNENQDAAIKEYQESLRINPHYITHNNLGLALFSKGNLDAAIQEYHEALRMNSNYMDAHNNLGTALANKGDLNAAILEFKEALRLSPKDVDAHNNLGFTLANKGDLDAAIQEYHEALQINPNNEYAQNNLRLALEKKKINNDGRK